MAPLALHLKLIAPTHILLMQMHLKYPPKVKPSIPLFHPQPHWPAAVPPSQGGAWIHIPRETR